MEVTPEYERRLASVERRLDWIDEHGTRGINALQIQIGTIQRDFGRLETSTQKLDAAIDSVSSRNWPQIVALIVAMVPLYALVITLIVGQHG